MLEKYIPKRFATAMIKHVIAVTLFFPYFYTKNGNPNYADFVLANFFTILAIVFICTSWKLEFKRNAIFVTGLSILLVAYNVCATYMNVKYHHWYGEQINTTIAFLLFIVLLLVKDIHALIDSSTIKATIHMIVASNVLAILFRVFTGYNQLRFMNDWVYLTTYPQTHQKQFAWLYGHKSEYGLMLVLCVAFCVVYRKHFQNIFTYVFSLGVLFVALCLSDSYTALGSALLIFVGQLLDYLWNAKWWKKLLAVVTIPIPIILIGNAFLKQLENNRDILTLGKRIPIWNTFTDLIQQNPNGIMNDFGTLYLMPHNGFTNNCHNVFLNHAFRFSIPVGGIFCAIFLLITLIYIKRTFTILALFTWIALYIPMTMDHSLTVVELPFFMLIVSMMCHTQVKLKKNRILFKQYKQ